MHHLDTRSARGGFPPHQQSTGYAVVLAALLAAAALSAPPAAATTGSGTGAVPGRSVASGCVPAWGSGAGWLIELCPGDGAVIDPMQVSIDGSPGTDAAMVKVSYVPAAGQSPLGVTAIDAAGVIRLETGTGTGTGNGTTNGTTVALGPHLWPAGELDRLGPSIATLAIDTTRLPLGPLLMQADARVGTLEVGYELTLPRPDGTRTRVHVQEHCTGLDRITADPTRAASGEGLQLVRATATLVTGDGSSSTTCGTGACLSATGLRLIGEDLSLHQVSFADRVGAGTLMESPLALGDTWIDVLADQGSVDTGGPPSLRIALDQLIEGSPVAAQGTIEETSDPERYQVDIWLVDSGLVDSGLAATSRTTGSLQTGSARSQAGQGELEVGYWIMATPEAPSPLGWPGHELDSGLLIAGFETGDGHEPGHDSQVSCTAVRQADQSTSAALRSVRGMDEAALQLDYDLGSSNGAWAQIRCDLIPPLDLSSYDHLVLDWRGDPTAASSIEVGLITSSSSTAPQLIFARGYHHPTHHGWWGRLVIPFRHLQPWTAGSTLDRSAIAAFMLSVVKVDDDDDGGAGSLAVDNIRVAAVRDRAVPTGPDPVPEALPSAEAAVSWLVSSQRPSGMIPSWEEETVATAHVYDQALALLVLTREQRWAEADALVEALAAAQLEDGSWAKSYDAADPGLACVHCQIWEGDIAWAILALDRYRSAGGTSPAAATAQEAAAAWLATRVDPGTGCLVIDHTEGTIDAWWALQTLPQHAALADGLRHCLLDRYWDEAMGRVKGGLDWWQPYLDNQTWGAAFLRAACEPAKAWRALSYARLTLGIPARSGVLTGLDGQAGPWGVWNEGTAQYVSLGGPGAAALLDELLAQQRADGAMPGGPDAFSGGGVWLTTWHGVAPTAWLYFALTGDPFDLGSRPACGARPRHGMRRVGPGQGR